MGTRETQAMGEFWKEQLMVSPHEAHFPCYGDNKLAQDTQGVPKPYLGTEEMATHGCMYVCQAMGSQLKKHLQSTLQQWCERGQTGSLHGNMDHGVF